MIKRYFYPYTEWECFKNGMYDTTTRRMDQHQLITDCETMLKCPQYLRESMLFVTHNWLRASHQHLSNEARNRRAWLGQAANCWAHGAPEFVTKIAWNLLTASDQSAANATADDVISDWEEKHNSGYWARVKGIS